MKRFTLTALSIALIGSATHAFAQSNYDTAKVELQKRLDTEKKAAAGNPDKKVWDFVIADKKAKTVTLLACGTNIKPTDPAEFFVAPVISGKDYESLAVTFAAPGDVRAALDFIGLKPGQPVDFEKNRFWPRGPRVIMTYTVAGKPVRAEAMILDTNTNKPLPDAGLVYTGSYTYTDEQGKTHIAADESDARPIAPTYNDPAALFDVPAQAAQSTVYGFRKPSPAWTVKAGEAVDVTLSLPTAHDAVIEKKATVQIGFAAGKARYNFSIGFLAISDTDFTLPIEDLPHLVSKIAGEADNTTDLFVSVWISNGVPVSEVRKLYAVLQAVEKDRGIKLDPPIGDNLFYRAFFPQPQWRDRSIRLGEPWELFLTRSTESKFPGFGNLTAKLERSVDNPDRNAVDAKIVESYTPADPADLAKEVNAKASRWSKAIFVYPPADLTYGELMAWVRPVLPTYPRVFVFPAEAPTTAPAATGPTK